MSRSCRFLLFWHHSYGVTLMQGLRNSLWIILCCVSTQHQVWTIGNPDAAELNESVLSVAMLPDMIPDKLYV